MKKLTISAMLLLFVVGLVLTSCKTGDNCPAYRSQVKSEQMH